MKRNHALIAMALLSGLSACSSQTGKPPAAPGDFALRMEVTARASAGLQQIALPASAIVASKRADLGDIRIFDGDGRALSVALDTDHSGHARNLARHAVRVSPLEQAGGTVAGGAVSVRVDQPGQSISVDAGAGNGLNEAGGAVILDTRKIEQVAVAVELDAKLPVGHAVTFTLDTSPDLRIWQPLAVRVLYRPGPGDALLGQGRIALPGVMLKNRTVRVSWDSRDASVSGAAILTSSVRPPARHDLKTRGGVLHNAHDLRFSVPFSAPIAAIGVMSGGEGGIVPLTLSGRNDPEHPWAPLAAASLRSEGREAELELAGQAMKEYRLEADRRSPGFSMPPRISLRIEPVTLLAAFTGKPPYTLAVGNAEAEPRFFAAHELGKPAELEQAAQLKAAVAAPALPVVELGSGGADGPFTPRKLALWTALLVATAVLALAAWRLMRGNAPPESDQSAGS